MVVRDSASSRKSNRKEHEARTGQCANMADFGYRCERWSKVGGVPILFTKLADGNAGVWSIIRTHGGQWRIALAKPGYKWPTTQKVLSPLFPGPIAAAMWLGVEKSNGNVRFAES